MATIKIDFTGAHSTAIELDKRDLVQYKVEVIADSSSKWASNALRFDSVESAEDYAHDLAMRWTAVRDWRVVAS